MKDLQALLRDHPFFAGMTDADLATLAGCAWNEQFEPGQHVFREGGEANRFYLIRHGRVALLTHGGNRGWLTLETLQDGDVLGWSWLIPPYRWQFDARARTTTRVTAFDGSCLRATCERDSRLGYDLVKRFAGELARRSAAARLQLLDVYGGDRDRG
ncbi:MAG: cyclic nucleotide-binding domain-containing protein [Pseudohaliea sp.]